MADRSARPDLPSVRASADSRESATVDRIRLWVGLVCLVCAVGYTQQASQLSVGELDQPGPGMYPLAVGVGFVVVSVIAVVEPLLRLNRGSASVAGADNDPNATERLDRTGRRRLVTFAAALVVYVLALRLFGFVLASVPFVVLVGWHLQDRRPSVAGRITLALVSVGLAIGVYLVFRQVFKVQLPDGVVF